MRVFWVGAVAALCLLGTSPLCAEAVVTYDSSQTFDDVVFALENSIIGHGLEVDGQSHLAELLDRAREDLGGGTKVFDQAEVYSFCSGKLAQKLVIADPLNIAYCPYTMFVFVRTDMPEVTTIGYRTMPDGPLKEVEALLDAIARNAAGWGS